MGRDRYKIIVETQPHLLTCSILNWLPLFGKPRIAGIILESMEFMQIKERMKINAYVIMENHMHFIASSSNLNKEISRFKSFTARTIIDYLLQKNSAPVLKELNYHKLRHKKDRVHQFWQEGSHPKAILTEETMIQKIEYIHNNPVVRGYVDEPVHWRYSSARNYEGRKGLIEVSVYGKE